MLSGACVSLVHFASKQAGLWLVQGDREATAQPEGLGLVAAKAQGTS